MRTILWSPIATDAVAAELAKHGDVRVLKALTELPDAIPGADAMVMANPTFYTAEIAAILGQSPNLKWLQLLSAGYEGIAQQGPPPGVVVTNAADCWSPTVAEHAIALLLALARRFPDALRAQDSAAWDRSIAQSMVSLEGRTLLIVGYGSIGREVARRAKGFGMRIVGVTRSGRVDPNADIQPDEIVAVDALLATLSRADAIALTLPLSPESRHLFSSATFEACRPGTLLVNVARGGLIDNAALITALETGRLAAAGLDVTDPEPLPSTDPLWHAPNLLITPHLAGYGSPLLARRLCQLIGDNARRFLTGQPLLARIF